MKYVNRLALILLSISLLAPGISVAAAPTSDATLESELTPGSLNGINYVSGGIGESQQKSMQEIRKDYNLLLTFATKKTGEFEADVKVNIQSSTGKTIFEMDSVGPLFYVKLPPGKYRINAELNGKSLSQSASVAKTGSKQLAFYWEEQP